MISNPRPRKPPCSATDPDPVEFEKDDGPTVYQYQFEIYRAACVDLRNDNSEQTGKKVQQFWRKFGRQLICDDLSFDVSNGSLLKYGVAQEADAFLKDVVKNWKVDLNQLDQTDETALDYIRQKLKESEGSSNEYWLRKTYKMFRDAGAKHKSEL